MKEWNVDRGQSLFPSCTFQAAEPFHPPDTMYGWSSTCSAGVFANSHSCTSTIQGIIYHRHLGKVLDGSDWCLRFSVTASSCLEPDDAPRGAVHSAD